MAYGLSLIWLRISAILGLFLFESFSLLSTIKEHRQHFEAVHLFTWSALVDIILSYVIYLITDILTLIFSTPVFYNPCRIIDNSLWLCFYLDVIAGDLNGFIYAEFDHVIYHDLINNNRTLVTIGKEGDGHQGTRMA